MCAAKGVRPRILVVEDEALIALGVSAVLREFGYDVCGVARTASDAVDAAGRERPDLALVDIGLKGGPDGVEAARQMRERYGVQTVFLTANSDAATRRRAALADPLGYILKPYSVEGLRQALEQALQRR